MSLDLQQVLQQVDQLGQEAARRAGEVSERLPLADRWLDQASELPPDELKRRIAAAGDSLRPARPSEEPVSLHGPLPPHPPHLRLVAADGSQVYPDRHAAAFFYLINVGAISIDHGSGRPPQVEVRSRLYSTDEDLHDSRGHPVDTHLVNAGRDAAELETLARLTEAPQDVPVLALLDNGLLLWAASQEQNASRPDVQRILQSYLDALDRMRRAGVALAGYISRPRNVHVTALAEAAAESPGSLRGLTDRMLFGRRLKPGFRSARFIHPARINDGFAARGHQIQFFYLHTGSQDGIARVEVPTWVAEDPARLDALHAAIVEQCRTTGIPYPLVRAHELALVSQDDRRTLEGLVQGTLVRHGISALSSQKAQTKRWTARRRRHRL